MYLLMFKDLKTIRFNYSGHKEILNKKWAPEMAKLSLKDFLYDRATKFRARETYQALLTTLGITDYRKIKEVLDRTYGLSLNDLYWIKKEDDLSTFADINFYENALDAYTARAGYTGVADHLGDLSPEYTTDGQLPKCLIKNDQGVFMIKRGSTWGEEPGREPYDEYYASQLLDALGIDHVPYDLMEYQGHLASICPYMTSLQYSYVPISCFEYTDEKQIYHDFVSRGFGAELRKMLLFDALTYNYDRHIGNFGYRKDNETGQYFFAPLFDNGNAFFPLATQEQRQDLMSYRHYVDISAMGIAFDDLIRDYLTDDEIALLDRLADFTIKPHPVFSDDVTCYNDFLKKRIDEIRTIYNQAK